MAFHVRLLRVLFVVVLFTGAGFAFAAERVIDLEVESTPVGVVLIYDAPEGLLIEPEAIPDAVISESARDDLPVVEADMCGACWRLSDLGEYTENRLGGAATLTLRPQWLPGHAVSLYKPRDASGKHLQRGFAWINNVSASFRDTNFGARGSLYLLDSRIGLGALGVLETGVRYVETETETSSESETIRLPSRLVRHFVDSRSTLALGELSTDADPTAGAVSITGIQIRRNFATRPDLTQRPVYDFFTQLERPSVIELYQDTQRVRREEFRQGGAVEITDYRPSGSGNVTLLITDALGTRRVVESELIVDAALLEPGVYDYSFSAGALRRGDEIDSDSLAMSFRVSRGITDQFTLGFFGEGVELDPISDNFQGRERIWNVGTSWVIGSPLGKFEWVGKYGESDLGEQFEAQRLSWIKNARLGRFNISTGAELFDSRGFLSVTGREDTAKGERAFIGAGYGRFFVSGNVYEVNDESGFGFNLGWRAGAVSLQASVSAVEDQDALYTLSVSYSPGSAAVSVGSQKAESQDALESFAAARWNHFEAGVSANARASYSDANYSSRGELGVRWSHDRFVAGYDARYFDDDQFEHFADFGFSAAFSGKAFYFGKPIAANEGLAEVYTGLPDVEFTVGQYTGQTNRWGYGALPVSGFGRRFARLDTGSLPPQSLPTSTQIEVSTIPGQSARQAFELNAPSAFIVIEGVAPGERVTVNGQVARVYEFGAFVENLVIGENRVEFRGKQYPLQVTAIDSDLPTFTLREEWFR